MGDGSLPVAHLPLDYASIKPKQSCETLVLANDGVDDGPGADALAGASDRKVIVSSGKMQNFRICDYSIRPLIHCTFLVSSFGLLLLH